MKLIVMSSFCILFNSPKLPVVNDGGSYFFSVGLRVGVALTTQKLVTSVVTGVETLRQQNVLFMIIHTSLPIDINFKR